MKINEKQLIKLLDIAKDTTQSCYKNDRFAHMDQVSRISFLGEIEDQLSREAVEVPKE